MSGAGVGQRPTGLLPPQAERRQGARAGVVSRTFVMVIDAITVAVVVVAVQAARAALRFMIHPRRFTWPSVSYPVLIGLAGVLAVLYLTAGWATTGRSVGKRVAGLRIVDRHGGTPSVPVAFIRAVTCVVFPFGLFWCAVSRWDRSLQDVIFRTSVIYDWRSRFPPERRNGRTGPSDDPLGMRVDVQAPVSNEADDGQAEAFARLDRQ